MEFAHAQKKGFKDFIDNHNPDVLFIQETKCAEAELA